MLSTRGFGDDDHLARAFYWLTLAKHTAGRRIEFGKFHYGLAPLLVHGNLWAQIDEGMEALHLAISDLIAANPWIIDPPVLGSTDG